MNQTIMNPYHLPLTPPMDLNREMDDIDFISPFPMQLRTRAGVGLFGTRRTSRHGDATRLLRTHQGIDLLAPVGTPVFAAADGEVIRTTGTSVLVLHDYGFKFLTFYQHLQNISVGLGDVLSGQQIGEVEDWATSSEDHLHFEIRLPFENASPTYNTSLPIDPTWAMYNWETITFQNDKEVRNVWDKVQIDSLEEIVRSRLLHFIKLRISGMKRDVYLPVQTGLPENESLINTLKTAFFKGSKVRITWRESLFFAGIEPDFDRAAIVAEVKVYK